MHTVSGCIVHSSELRRPKAVSGQVTAYHAASIKNLGFEPGKLPLSFGLKQRGARSHQFGQLVHIASNLRLTRRSAGQTPTAMLQFQSDDSHDTTCRYSKGFEQILPTVENPAHGSRHFYNGFMSQDDFISTPDAARTFSLSATPKSTVSQSSASEPELNKWRQAMQDPTHSQRYAQRWERFEAEGKDIDGEGRAIDAMAARGSTILDAGAGNGRVAGYLASAGHEVVGIDLDPYLIDVANTKYPQARFEVADLADFELRDEAGELQKFDIIVSAGNVQTFLADWERIPALTNVAKHMHATSRFVTGFQLARGYSDAQFTADASAAGLEVYQRFGTWQFDPYVEDGEFLLAVLRLKS